MVFETKKTRLYWQKWYWICSMHLLTISMTLTGPIMLWSEYSWKLPKCTSALQKKRISGNEGLSHSLFIANGSWQLQSHNRVKWAMKEHSYFHTPRSAYTWVFTIQKKNLPLAGSFYETEFEICAGFGRLGKGQIKP